MIPKNPLNPSFAVYAALGTAVSYYTFPLIIQLNNRATLILSILILFIFAVSFLRVLVHGSFLFSADKPKINVPRFILKINLAVLSVVAGFCLGVVLRAGTGGIYLPLSHDRIIGLSGIISDDPRAFNDGRGMGALELKTAAGAQGLRVTASGKITVFFPAGTIPRLKEFGRGSEIYIEGTLIEGGRGLVFRAAQVHIVKPASAIEQFRTNFRTASLEKFGILQDGSVSPPVWGGLASAMLLGIRDDLDVDLAASFKNSGCAHILSLSGMNLALLSGAIAFLLSRLIGIKAASLAGAAFIILYIFLAGAQPSLARSGIIYLLGTLAVLGFFRKNALSLLALAFLIQLLIRNDSGATLSFILSYLAIAGIIITGSSFYELLRGKIPDVILSGFSASLGAFTATAAISAFYFGVLYPIGLVAGLLIMPVATIFTFLAFVSFLLVSLIPVLFGAVDVMLTMVYRFLEILVTNAAVVPGVETLSVVPVLAASLAIIALLEFLKYKNTLYRSSVASFDA